MWLYTVWKANDTRLHDRVCKHRVWIGEVHCVWFPTRVYIVPTYTVNIFEQCQINLKKNALKIVISTWPLLCTMTWVICTFSSRHQCITLVTIYGLLFRTMCAFFFFLFCTIIIGNNPNLVAIKQTILHIHMLLLDFILMHRIQ